MLVTSLQLNLAASGGGTTITATPGEASAVGVTAAIQWAINAVPGEASATGVTALLPSAVTTTPGEASATGVTALVSGGGAILCTPAEASATGVAALIDVSGQLPIGGTGFRPFPQKQKKRETEAEKEARRIAQGILPPIVEEIAREQEPEPVNPLPDVLARRAVVLRKANESTRALIADLESKAAEMARQEIERIQALRAIETEENDIAFVMALLAHA